MIIIIVFKCKRKMKHPEKQKPIVSLQHIPFEKLVFLENNPRTRTAEGLQKMASDIASDPNFYQNRPTLVNLVDGVFYVYAGDLRAHAAHDVLGWDDIPCNVEQDVPADVQKRRAILDNTHREEWDSEKLSEWGYDEDELEEMGVWIADGVDDGGVEVPALSDEEMAAFFEKQTEQQVADQKHKIVLEYTEDDFRQVKEALAKVAKTPEQAVWQLLNIEK